MAIETSKMLQAESPALVVRRQRNLFMQVLIRLLRDPRGRLGAGLVLFLVLMGVLAPIVAPHDPLLIGADNPLGHPTLQNPFGTDDLGRDELSRIIFGAQISIRVSFLSAIAALVVAAPFGLVAGYRGGTLDGIICRVFDTIFAFPSILIGVALMAALGGSVSNVILAIAITSLPTMGRLTRVGVMAQRNEDYVLAAHALGAPERRIIARHILPNVLPSLFVQMTLIMGSAVLLEASFSFLGMGARPPTPSWGVMLNEGRNYLNQAPWLGIFPGLFVTGMILGFNSLGDALQRALNPRLINQ